MFSCSDSLVLHIVAIFCNLHERNQFSLIELYDKLGLNFKNTWPIFTALRLILCYIEFCFGKCFDHLTWFWLSLWYIRLEFEKHLNYLTGLKLIFWYIGVRLRLPYWIWTDFVTCFRKNTWTNLLDSDWFYYKQAEMLFEKSQNLLKLSVNQLAIQSRLASSISLGQSMFTG